MQLNKYQKEVVEHIDGPCVVTSCPGSGKCVAGDTLVLSNNIFISKIKDNKVNNIIGLSSENFSDISSKSMAISDFVDSGKHYTIKISTQNGYSLEGTHDHPIAVVDNNGNFQWKKLKDVKVGEFSPIWVNDKKDFNYELDEKFYFIGLLIGDGCLSSDKQISFSSEKNNVSDKFCQIVKKYYNYECKVRKDKRRKNLYSFYIYSVDIIKNIKQEFGDIFHYSYNKYLTYEILESSKSKIASLIRGIFDTDGSVSNSCCDIILSSKKIIDQLHVLLLHYGIFSTKTIKEYKRKGYYRIQIYGNNYRRFVKNIGFGHFKKKEISEKILFKKNNSNQIIPFMHNKIDTLSKELSSLNPKWYNRSTQTILNNKYNIRIARNKTSKVKNTRNITEDTINKIEYAFKDFNYNSDVFNNINEKNRYCYSKISNIEYSNEKKQVYDYVVPKTHNFISNGFISHNTFVLVERVCSLIKKGIKPKNILCLTFTNKAANEMKERICQKLGLKKPGFFIGTFHSLCSLLIRTVGSEVGYFNKFTILDDKDQQNLISQLARQLEYDINSSITYHIAYCLNYYRDQMEDFSWVEEKISNSADIEIASLYIDHCRKNNLLDFSGLIYEAIKIIENNENIKNKIQNTFKYILVDETQDTNKSQFHLINLLGEKYNNVMIIGDPDQCIIRGEKILTSMGYKNVEEVNEEDKVLCMEKDIHKDGYSMNIVESKINKIYNKEVIDYTIVKIKTLYLKEAIYSKDHMVFASLSKKQIKSISKDIGELSFITIDENSKLKYYLIPAIFLEKDMPIISCHYGRDKIKSLICSETALFFDYVDKVEFDSYTGSLYDLEVDKHHNFISSGIVSHNSIYGWRGARFKNIQDFIDRHDNCRIISLSKNYRSTPQIINVASRLIKHNDSHVKIKFETDNPNGENIRCRVFNDQVEEAEWIGDTVKRLISDGGWDPEDMAVLYRVNKMSEPIEQSFVNNGIPYEVIGAYNFYDRKEIKDCLAMARFLVNPRDGVSFHRISKFLGNIGNITIGKIEKLASSQNISILKACKEIIPQIKVLKTKKACENIYNIYNKRFDLDKPSVCFSSLINDMKYIDYIDKEYGDNSLERKENIDQIINSSGEFNNEKDGLFKYLQQISLFSPNDKDNKDNKVSLMSLHAAKGLEFPIVFIIGVEDKILPHKQSVADDPYTGIEEERRLCYVGITRAKKILYLTWCRRRKKFGMYGQMKYEKSTPSRFLFESGLLKKRE